jgi:glycosyltransferase involved in cell wall biosynthesis
MRILLLSPNQYPRYNWGHQLFRNAIGQHHEVLYYGPGYTIYDDKLTVKKIIKRHYKNTKPDVIMTYGRFYTLPFKGIGEVDDIIKINVAMDYMRPDAMRNQNIMFKDHKYDLLFGTTMMAVNALKANNACERVHFLPFSVDTNIYRYKKMAKDNDVLAAFTARKDMYPHRWRIKHILKQMGVSVIGKGPSQHKLISAINRSKITVTSNNKWNSMSMRYTETLACGGFLLADKPGDFDRLGYVDGKHLVLYKDFDDFRDKVKYYLNHDKERYLIEKKGMKFVRKNHSCERRVQEFTDILTKEFGLK